MFTYEDCTLNAQRLIVGGETRKEIIDGSETIRAAFSDEKTNYLGVQSILATDVMNGRDVITEMTRQIGWDSKWVICVMTNDHGSYTVIEYTVV